MNISTKKASRRTGAISFSLLKSTGTCTNLSISNLSTSVFKLAKFAFNAKLEVSDNQYALLIFYLL